MAMIDGMIEELKQESVSTRKHLERVPENAFDWKPHTKSMAMMQLASHIADTPSWAAPLINQDEMTFDPETYKPWIAGSKSELLETFDKNVAGALEAMQGVTDDKMMVTWTMKMKEQIVLTLPRVAVLRVFILGHLIHHRAQLGVYLRLRDVPVPQVYGPTADEQ